MLLRMLSVTLLGVLYLFWNYTPRNNDTWQSDNTMEQGKPKQNETKKLA